MDIFSAPREVTAQTLRWNCAGDSVGFVPTMGALHEGHLALAKRARAENERVIASIFVNPTQFAPHEDLAKYPRPFERDCALLREAGCDLLFAPTPRAMYSENHDLSTQTFIGEGAVGALWEGEHRPRHFRGVATVVGMLFNIVRPQRAYFGEKDFQQLQVIRHMARHLHFGVEIIGCETVREADGLAMSSRNVYLSPTEREAALCLSRALQNAQNAVREGERDATVLLAQMRAQCEAQPLCKLQYAAVVDADTLQPLAHLGEGRAARVLIAAHVGSTRLIDNMALPL